MGTAIRGIVALVLAVLLAGCAGQPLRIACNGFAGMLQDAPNSRIVASIEADQQGPRPASGLDDAALVRHATALLRTNSYLQAQLLGITPEAAPLSMAEAAHRPARVPGPIARPIPTLLLSGGGQWGAFGAAFLEQAYRNNPAYLPPFGIVTGVSTGAMQALFVARSNEPEPRQASLRAMVAAYSIASEGDIVERGGAMAVVTRGAMARLDPLHARIIRTLCPPDEADGGCPMVVDLAQHRGALAFVGLVDAASGDFRYVLLNQLAASQLDQPGGTEAERQHRAAECLAGAVLASSAMPVYYQQVMVGSQAEGFRTYIDGGARNSVFLASMARLFSPAVLNAALAAPGTAAAETGRLPSGPASIYMVRNGPTNAQPMAGADQPWNALSAAKRSYALMVNQSEVNALAAVRLLQPTGDAFVITADGFDSPSWRAAALATPNAPFREICTKQNPDAMFEPQFMACLRQFGQFKAGYLRDGSPWLPVAEVAPAQP